MKGFKMPGRPAVWAGLLLTLFLSACGGSSGGGGNAGTPPGGAPTNGFTLAVLPDTQKYSRYTPERFMAQTRWIADNYVEENIAFTVHLGDVVDLPREESEWFAAREAMQILEATGATPYSILAGNHDVLNSGQWDNQRNNANEPFLRHFPASLQESVSTTFQGTDDTGFNSYHIFAGHGREYLVLALDWRVSDDSLVWVQSVLDAHPDLPTILTTHQLLNIAGDNETAIFTDHGIHLWDNLIRRNDQIFLTLNGHHHGEAMMVGKNDFGRDVVMVVVDYQSYFWGGNGMMQLITFNEDENLLAFRSYSPWVAAIPEEGRLPQDELSRWEFEVPMNFSSRFQHFGQDAGEAAPGNIEGTEAYWILDRDHLLTSTDGMVRFADASGNGNVMTLTAFNEPEGEMAYFFDVTDERAPFGFASGSARFGGSNADGGYYLEGTGPSLTFETSDADKEGFLPTYTIEAIVRLPAGWTPGRNQWSGILNHRPSVTQVCQYHEISCTGGDASVGLNVSSLKEFQWVSASQNGKGQDNWSWSVADEYWYHIALVNDGERVLMYVDGVTDMRTGIDPQHGLLVQPGQPWSIGINSWNGTPGNLFAGDIAEIRINNRVLPREEWLYSH